MKQLLLLILTKKMMTIVNNFKLTSLSFFVLILFISCKDNKNMHTNETYSVFSLVYNRVVEENLITGAFHPEPPGQQVKANDIIPIKKNKLIAHKKGSIDSILKKRVDLVGKTYVSIYPKSIKPPIELKDIVCDNFNDLTITFLNNKEVINIDFLKITPSNYGYLKKFNESYLSQKEKEFNSVQFFSPVSFNKDYSKAILSSSITWGKLTGYTKIYFLEKRNKNWEIACEGSIGKLK